MRAACWVWVGGCVVATLCMIAARPAPPFALEEEGQHVKAKRVSSSCIEFRLCRSRLIELNSFAEFCAGNPKHLFRSERGFVCVCVWMGGCVLVCVWCVRAE
jgi:hypothetical protein